MGSRYGGDLRVILGPTEPGKLCPPSLNSRHGIPASVTAGLALLFVALAGCNDQQSSRDAARDDQVSEIIHEQTDDQFNNMTDELSNIDARLNEIEATQNELADEAETQHRKVDDLDSRLSDVERKTEGLPD